MSTNGYDHDAGYGNGADESDFEHDDLMEDEPDLYEDYMDFEDDEDEEAGRIVPTSSCAACCCRLCPASRSGCTTFRA